MPESAGWTAVRVTGQWEGAALNHRGKLRLTEDAVEVVSGPTMRLSWSALEGVAWRSGELALYGAGSALVLRGDALDRIWVDLLRLAAALPEWTAALRAFGSRHGGNEERQERFFAPFLHARRRLEEVVELEWRLDAFDATTLAERVRATLAALARGRYAEETPHRRALEAWLLDEVEPLLASLMALDEAAQAVRDAPDATRLVAWRGWTARAGEMFRVADRCWLAAEGLLSAEGPAPRVTRRRRFGGGARKFPNQEGA